MIFSRSFLFGLCVGSEFMGIETNKNTGRGTYCVIVLFQGKTRQDKKVID